MKPTQEQVIAWAREAGFATSWTEAAGEALECFATLAYEAGRKDENEACAKVCEHFLSSKKNDDAWIITMDLALQAAADVIRRRGKQ